MTFPCTLPRSWKYLFEPSTQLFVDQPVHCTPMIMLQMTTYPSTLSIIVNVLLYRSTVMSEPWRKSKNWTEIPQPPTLFQNQLVNMHYLNAFPTASCCPTNFNWWIPSWEKTLVSLNPLLLISTVPSLYNITSTPLMLNPSSKEHTALATIVVRKLKSRWRRCYEMVLLNLVLALGPDLLSCLQKQMTHYDSV